MWIQCQVTPSPRGNWLYLFNDILTLHSTLRDRYIKLQHTINKLLYKLYQDGTMIFLKLQEALRIPGIHFSPQHHTDSKGKPEGRIIGDLSGQHDENFTPLNGSANDKNKLRDTIEQQWGVIKHPTVEMLVKMVLTSADLHGWDNCQFTQLQSRLLSAVRFPVNR